MSLARIGFISLVIWLFSFSVADNVSAGTVTYIYDDANRLVRVSNSVGAMSYSFDIVGNRLNTMPPETYISIIPISHSFGEVVVGTTSSPVMLNISSVGSEALTINEMSFIGTDAAMFHMSLSGTNPCPQIPFSLGIEESCTVELTFGPTSSGAKSASFRISSNDPDTPEFDVPLSGNGIAFYTLTVEKTGAGTGTVESLDGNINCGALCSHVYDGGASVALSASPDSGFVFQGWSGGGCSGNGDCFLAMNLDTTVTATFSLAPDLEVTPSSHNYGNVFGGDVDLQTFIASNIGSADLIIESMSIIGADASEYSIENDTCSNQTVVPSGSCTFDVKFEPTSVGSKTSGVEIISNDSNSPENVPLSGISISGRNIVVRSVLLNEDFGSGIPADWTIVGLWHANTNIRCTRAIGSPFIDPWAIIDSACLPTSNDQLLTPNFSTTSCSDVDILYSNQFDAGMGSTASIDTSIDGGQIWAEVSVIDTDDGYPTANWKEMDITGTAGYENVKVRFDYDATVGFWAIDNVWALCQPAELYMTGQVFETSDPETVMVTNKGFEEDLTIGTISLTGDDSSEFIIQSDDCSGQLLTPDSDCTISVVMTPSSMGPKSATLIIPSDDPDTPTFSVPLSSYVLGKKLHDFNGDGYVDILGVNSAGTIWWYDIPGETWVNIPLYLEDIVVGNFTADIISDIAGISARGQIWWYDVDAAVWHNITGSLASLEVGDFNGDGNDDIAGINASSQIKWYDVDAAVWHNITGSLASLEVGDFNGDGNDDIAGINASGQIRWYDVDGAVWHDITGSLASLEVGDFNGDGNDDIAGINASSQIWWYDMDGAVWHNIPGSLVQVVVGDYDRDGEDDIAGLNSAGQIWYTTDLSTWQNISGSLEELY
jgi:hypothetical protein